MNEQEIREFVEANLLSKYEDVTVTVSGGERTGQKVIVTMTEMSGSKPLSAKDIMVDLPPEAGLPSAIVTEQVVRQLVFHMPVPKTDKQKLNLAFQMLRRHGVIARQNWQCCNSCGMSAMDELIENQEAKGKDVHGLVFYHAQAKETMLLKGELLLNFSRSTNDDAPGDFGTSEKVGKFIVSVLEIVGLSVEWNGKATEKIKVLVTA